MNETNTIVTSNAKGLPDAVLRPHPPQYQAVDHLINRAKLRNDAELARFIGVTAATVSKIRAGKVTLSPGILLRLHETFDMPVAELRRLFDGS